MEIEDVALPLAPRPAEFTPRRETIANATVLSLSTPGVALQRPKWTEDELYREVTVNEPKPFELKLVPYFAWGNRGDTEMSVWIPAR